MQNIGGIVLCGGKSTRMGTSKALLPFGPEVMLQRVVRVLGGVVSPLVVVAAPGQELPDLPAEVRIVYDEYDALGPLAGLAAGLAALRDQVDAAYVSACDAPLLKPEFVQVLIAALGTHDLVIPRDGRFHHPLAAVYRTQLADRVRGLVEQRRLRPLFLVEESDAREIDVAELKQVDPELQSLRNTNTPEDYAAALREAFETTNGTDHGD